MISINNYKEELVPKLWIKIYQSRVILISTSAGKLLKEMQK